MSKAQAVKQFKETGLLPDGYVALDDGEIIPRSRLCCSLRTSKEDPSKLARSNGTTYQRQPDGSHKRIGGKPLSKKALKKLKREIAKDPMAAKVMEMMKDPGREVTPHRSGGGIAPMQMEAISATVDGLELGPCTVTIAAPEPGIEEGSTCNRDGCEGTMVLGELEGGCTCFRNAPCAACMGRNVVCDECGEVAPNGD